MTSKKTMTALMDIHRNYSPGGCYGCPFAEKAPDEKRRCALLEQDPESMAFWLDFTYKIEHPSLLTRIRKFFVTVIPDPTNPIPWKSPNYWGK